MILWIFVWCQHIHWILLASAEKQLLAHATTAINLKFTKLRICAKWRSCIKKWNIEQEWLKTMMYYYMWDYSVFRLYSSPGVIGKTRFRNWIWFLNVLFVTPDDGKVQKLINPECELAVHPANWHSLLFVQMRSLLTVLCHCLCRQGHVEHPYGSYSYDAWNSYRPILYLSVNFFQYFEAWNSSS